MMYTLQQLFKMEMDQLAKERETTEPDPVIWRWSPLEITEFDIMLHVAVELLEDRVVMKQQPFSLVEAGSGIGTKLYLAKHKYRLIEYGYEINPEYLKTSRSLGVHAEQRDLGDMDNQPAWSAYDIVYTARPFKDDMFETRWERSVQEDMRPGAVLISAFTAVKPYSWPCHYRRPFRGVWVKPEHDGPDTPAAANMMQNVTVT